MNKPKYEIYSEYNNDLMLQNKYTEIRDDIANNKTMEFNIFLGMLSPEQKQELGSTKSNYQDVLTHYINMKINGVKYSSAYAASQKYANNYYNDKTYSTYSDNSFDDPHK
jgi:hypothetical protein